MQLIPRDYLGAGHQLVGAPRRRGVGYEPEAVGAPSFRWHSRRFSEMGAAPAYALRDSGLASRHRSPTAAARHPYPRGNEGASRLGAAAPFVSIGRGAAPSGPLSSGGTVAVSRRSGRLQPMHFATPAWQAAAGVGRRRRAVPTLGGTRALRALVRQHPSCQLVGAPRRRGP